MATQFAPAGVIVMGRYLVLRADDVEPYIYAGDDAYLSQQVLGSENTTLHDVFLNRGVVKAGRSLHGGSHPENDEVYYIVSGRSWLDLGGHPTTGEGARSYRVEAGMVIFIPAGTYHRLRNDGDEDLVILTIWPQPAGPGAHGIHEQRMAEWGSGFRLRAGRRLVADGDGAVVVAESAAE